MTNNKSTVTYIRTALLEMPPKFDPPTEGYLRHQGLDTNTIRPMGLNECMFSPSPKVIQAIHDNVGKIGRYPDAQPPTLSDMVSEMFGVATNNIVWGNGSEELIKGAIDLSVAPGDGIVIPVPTFWGYRSLVAAAEADAKFIQLEPNGKMNVDAVTHAIDNQTKAVFCVTPNNPSGAILPQGDLDNLISGVPENVLFVVDEAYLEFGLHVGGPDVVEAVKKREGPWILIRTFSKAYAMAGMRIGYALCSDGELAQALRKTTCVFNVPILAMAAAEAALLDTDHLRFIMESVVSARQQLTTGLEELGLSPFPSATNFVSVELPVPGTPVTKEMLERGIQIHTWPDPGFENFIRITVGRPEDNDACLKALGGVLAEYISSPETPLVR